MSIELRPNLSEKQLIGYFIPRLATLAPSLNAKVFKRGLNCTASARLIVEDMGGQRAARIWWVQSDEHAYVVRNGQGDDEPAYNNTSSKNLRTVKYVKTHGEDYTQSYLNETWERLDMI